MMFLLIILAILLGVTSGVITGLIPGIHINLISLILISVSPILLNYTSIISLACFIIAMSVTHSFLDSIPSIYLGAPDSATALGVLPGHRYLMKGLGYQAVKLTVIGSFASLILSILLIPILIPIIKISYPILKNYIGYLLLAMMIYMILRDKKKLTSLLVFITAGIFGYLTLNIYNIRNPLFPMLSGLFGISTLIFSLNDTTLIPVQKISTKIFVKPIHAIKAISSSTIAGFLTSMFPGLGSAQGAVIAMQLARNIGDHGFMILMGGINTVNFTLSLITLYTLNKARNGAVIAVQKLIETTTLTHILIYITTALIAGAIATQLALFFARIFSKIIPKINYKVLVISIIAFITILTYPLSGIMGLLTLTIATFLGFIPAITKCSRTHAMGCLILPVLIYFLI